MHARLLLLAFSAVLAVSLVHGARPIIAHNGVQMRQLKADAQKNLADNMNALMNAFCRFQSGSDCGEIDWKGTTDWYRRYFITLAPTQISSGLDAPKVPLNTQTLANKTASLFFCPYRDFKYICQLDKQAFQSQTTTTSHSSGWNVGTTLKDAVTNAHTDQDTTVESMQVTMNPAQKKCLLLTTRLSTVAAKGTQNAYVSVDGWVGTHQDPARHWKFDANAGETHYYRAMTWPYVVQASKDAGLAEAADWTIVNGQARIIMPFDIAFDMGTSGSVSNSWWDAGSADCAKNDPSNSGIKALSAMGMQADAGLPVIEATRVPM